MTKSQDSNILIHDKNIHRVPSVPGSLKLVLLFHIYQNIFIDARKRRGVIINVFFNRLNL